jgi:hypothetical protein
VIGITHLRHANCTGVTMATSAPSELAFRQRYSPNGEMTISAAGSVALHALVVGILLLFGAYVARLFLKPARPMPIVAVHLKKPGDGGRPASGDNQPGNGDGLWEEDKGQPGDQSQAGVDIDNETPALTKAEKIEAKRNLAPAIYRDTSKNDTDQARRWKRLQDATRRITRPGPNPNPKSDAPRGPATGPKLTKREQRMLRWNLHFPTSNPQDYLRQLAGLGAILALPLDDSSSPQYKVVRDLLTRPAQLAEEDLSKIQRIFWIDDNPANVRDVLTELGVNVQARRFIAFMPVELENKLFEMERKHMEKRYSRFDEDRIYETRFEVVGGTSGKVEPRLKSMKLKLSAPR